jgi:hypothetical protein
VGNALRTQARRVLLRQVAPAYHQASGSQKQHILEEFVTATGYVRKYAQRLLNHSEEVFAQPAALRQRYGPEVEEALVLAWKTLNRICAKRLIPFLPSIVEALEAERHLELDEEHRRLLLSMSAATADRLLQAHRYTHPHGLSTTKAGPLLKQQIPIRTFAQWDEAKPGFLEVDLVAHCGGRLEGGCLYTITLKPEPPYPPDIRQVRGLQSFWGCTLLSLPFLIDVWLLCFRSSILPDTFPYMQNVTKL